MKNIYENPNIRKGKRISLGFGINRLLQNVDESNEDLKLAYRTAKVQSMFKECCKHLYGEAAFLVLQNINGVFLFSEKEKQGFKHARPDAPTVKKLAIYTCDSTIYADIDSRQEMFKYWFMKHGERVEKLDIYSSKFQMRKKFPFKNESNFLRSNATNNALKASLVLPENIEEIMPQVEKIKNEKLKKSIKNLLQQNK